MKFLNSPKCYVFDFDGVILDTVNIKMNAFLEIYSKEESDFLEMVKKYHLINGGLSRVEKFKHFESKKKGAYTEEEISSKCLAFEGIVKKNTGQAPFISGFTDFLKRIPRDIPKYIVSGAPSSELVELCKIKNIFNEFVSIYGSDKSKVVHINSILEKNNFFPQDVIFFGDSSTDYLASRNTGIRFFGINWSSPETFSDITCFKDFSDILSRC